MLRNCETGQIACFKIGVGADENSGGRYWEPALRAKRGLFSKFPNSGL